MIKRKRKSYTVEDLDYTDLELLAKAYTLQDDEFLCMGVRAYKLVALGLMSDENQITYEGRRFIWNWQQERKN
jgi:hypothetical protein